MRERENLVRWREELRSRRRNGGEREKGRERKCNKLRESQTKGRLQGKGA